MIKAEIISHEGTPGPNWLDRCRSAATPARLSVFVAVLLVGGVSFYTLTDTNDTNPPAAANQQNTYPEESTLQVQPLEEQSVQNESNLPAIQSADGGDTPAPSTQSTDSNGLGAPATPSFNAGGANAELQSTRSVPAEERRAEPATQNNSKPFEGSSKSPNSAT